MLRHFGFFFFLITLHLSGQISDTLPAVTVTSYKEMSFRETSANIIPIPVDSLSRFGNFTLTDLLARTPGIDMLSSGPSISKPAIRGLYGNRVLVLLSGLKFDNQQWQEEHGLGLADLGLSKVEVIKGPMGVLYGSEAIGGVINLVEEDKPALLSRKTDFSIKLHSNTMGGLVQAGTKANYGNIWYRLRAGVENHGDYSDGNGIRVLNSRFDGYHLKATLGFVGKKWVSTNNFSSSFNRFGFIFSDIYTFIEPDARWSRQLNKYPAHLVLLNVLSSENKIYTGEDSKLYINAGIQSNERMENEGGGAISLNMHLLTAQYLIKWEHQLSEAHTLIVSHLGSFEDNTNFGARKIVPDARMLEGNLSLYSRWQFSKKWDFENGIGGGEKWVRTYFNPTVNSPGKEIQPFTRSSPYYNIFSGLSFIPSPQFNSKLNLATGVRIPNLAELSSDGLHEGIFTYEIGSPDLKNERNLSLNLLAHYQREKFEATVTPFLNYFRNFIYLAPSGEEWFGFPVYRYRQQDATQYGTEALITVRPLDNLRWSSSYAGMISMTADGNHTPYTPARQVRTSLLYEFKINRQNSLQLFTDGDYHFAQPNTYPGEIVTPAYFLLNGGLSATLSREKTTYEISLSGNNILNNPYFDHLSRFKNFGLLNMGRNITLLLKMKLHSKVKES